MVKTKPLEEIKDKWAKRAAVAEPDYTRGIDRTTDWAENTAAAEGSYEAGVSNAISKKRFGAGVRERGTEGWKTRTKLVGPRRWREGIAGSKEEFGKGMGRNLAVIQGVDLGPRGPAGSSENYDRGRKIGEALHKMKTGE